MTAAPFHFEPDIALGFRVLRATEAFSGFFREQMQTIPTAPRHLDKMMGMAERFLSQRTDQFVKPYGFDLPVRSGPHGVEEARSLGEAKVLVTSNMLAAYALNCVASDRITEAFVRMDRATKLGPEGERMQARDALASMRMLHDFGDTALTVAKDVRAEALIGQRPTELGHACATRIDQHFSRA